MNRIQYAEQLKCTFRTTLALTGLLLSSVFVAPSAADVLTESKVIVGDENQPRLVHVKSFSKNIMEKSTARAGSSLKSNLESVSAVSFSGDKIRAKVKSTGCTSSNDFIVEYEIVNGMCYLSVVRTKPDLCRKTPFIAEVEIDWSVPADCNGLEISVKNPLLETSPADTLIKRTQ